MLLKNVSKFILPPKTKGVLSIWSSLRFPYAATSLITNIFICFLFHSLSLSQALREKEKGCWKKLSVQEKKALYRASYCQTFSEMKYPSGEWKMCLGFGLIAISMSITCMLLMKAFVYEKIPETFDDEHQKAQLKRMLDLGVGPVNGLSSKWDYDNNKWK